MAFWKPFNFPVKHRPRNTTSPFSRMPTAKSVSLGPRKLFLDRPCLYHLWHPQPRLVTGLETAIVVPSVGRDATSIMIYRPVASPEVGRRPVAAAHGAYIYTRPHEPIQSRQPSGPIVALCTALELFFSAQVSCSPAWALYALKPHPTPSPMPGQDNRRDR